MEAGRSGVGVYYGERYSRGCTMGVVHFFVSWGRTECGMIWLFRIILLLIILLKMLYFTNLW